MAKAEDTVPRRVASHAADVFAIFTIVKNSRAWMRRYDGASS